MKPGLARTLALGYAVCRRRRNAALRVALQRWGLSPPGVGLRTSVADAFPEPVEHQNIRRGLSDGLGLGARYTDKAHIA